MDRLRFSEPWGDPNTAPLQLRFFDQRLLDAGATVADDDDPLPKTDVNIALPPVVAEDIVRLLDSGARIHDPAAEAADEDYRLVGPGDIAVLVRTKHESRRVHDALIDVGVPAVRRLLRPIASMAC